MNTVEDYDKDLVKSLHTAHKQLQDVSDRFHRDGQDDMNVHYSLENKVPDTLYEFHKRTEALAAEVLETIKGIEVDRNIRDKRLDRYDDK